MTESIDHDTNDKQSTLLNHTSAVYIHPRLLKEEGPLAVSSTKRSTIRHAAKTKAGGKTSTACASSYDVISDDS
jgi:hypothetical protein